MIYSKTTRKQKILLKAIKFHTIVGSKVPDWQLTPSREKKDYKKSYEKPYATHALFVYI